MDEWAILDWFGKTNYSVMSWCNDWWWWCWIGLFFSGTFISMAPLATHHEQTFLQIVAVWLRRLILLLAFSLFCMPFIMLFIYDMTMRNELGDHIQVFLKWFIDMSNRSPLVLPDWIKHWWLLAPAMVLGWTSRFCYNRYFLTLISNITKNLRRNQSNDKPSDILDEAKRYKAKVFIPSKYYSDKGISIGLGEDNKPIRIPWDVWKENMMQIIGPTGFGKGVILGGVMEQVIRNGQTVFSINPKKDKFLPYIMYCAAKLTNRKFYYVSLKDGELGSWGPFIGGDEEDAFTRLTMAFKLELTGEPKTDFYKRQEIRLVRRSFKQTRRIDGLFNQICGEGAETAEAELEVWKDYKSLCPSSKKGFSIAKAIEENAVVYVQGSLDNRVIKTATKIFIAELIQECRRLSDEDLKHEHLTIAIDETSFLMSKVVKEALATIRSYGVTIINAYQSPNDLLTIEDDTIDGRSLQHSVNINSQIKAIYGGADFELAEWASLMSGTTSKQVTKMESTDIKDGGGEIWDATRTIGALEEALIHPNVVLSLPKGVCVFKQPYELPTILFPSFVPVNDKVGLDNYLGKNKKPESKKITNKIDKVEQPTLNEKDRKEIDNFQEMAESTKKETEKKPFSTGKNTEDVGVKTEEKKKRSSKEKSSISHAKPEENKNANGHNNTTPLPSPTKITAEDNEAEKKKRDKNKLRKEKQKQRRKDTKENLPSLQEAPITQEEIAANEPNKSASSKAKVDSKDDGLAGFLDNSQSDESTLTSLLDNAQPDETTLMSLLDEDEDEDE
jgi:hypothetical protein